MADTPIRVGETVRIEMRYHSPLLPALFDSIPTTQVFVGEVLPREDYDPLDSLRMTSDDPMVSLRVVAMRNILSWNGATFVYTSHEAVKERMPEKIKVSGSNGAEYTITIQPNGAKTCTCPGYGFRARCKHVDAINDRLRGE